MNNYPFELDNFDPEVDEITSEVVEHHTSTTDRSMARRSTLQILYEIDTTDHPVGEVMDAHIQERPESSPVIRIIRTFIQGIMEHLDVLDQLIQQYAPEWPVDQIAIIDRNILRIAVFEYAIQKRTPTPVIINEAVHLAQVFGAENSHGFVHGVLGAIIAGETFDNDPLIDDETEVS